MVCVLSSWFDYFNLTFLAMIQFFLTKDFRPARDSSFESSILVCNMLISVGCMGNRTWLSLNSQVLFVSSWKKGLPISLFKKAELYFWHIHMISKLVINILNLVNCLWFHFTFLHSYLRARKSIWTKLFSNFLTDCSVQLYFSARIDYCHWIRLSSINHFGSINQTGFYIDRAWNVHHDRKLPFFEQVLHTNGYDDHICDFIRQTFLSDDSFMNARHSLNIGLLFYMTHLTSSA